MLNDIEGNYEEILEDLEKMVRPVQYHAMRGSDTDGNKLNWGLFSICEVEIPKGMARVSPSVLEVKLLKADGLSWTIVPVEDPANSHRIRF